jgi:hypothetical protein
MWPGFCLTVLSLLRGSAAFCSPLPLGERNKVRGIKKEKVFSATLTLTLSLTGRGKLHALRVRKPSLWLFS